MRVALVVPGRWHAFDLAKALLKVGHEVDVYSSLPRARAVRWGLPHSSVHAFPLHGALSRIRGRYFSFFPEQYLHVMFGRWAARKVLEQSKPYDVVHSWSGVSEELLTSLHGGETMSSLMRGSMHIRTQAALLEEEEQRVGMKLSRPTPWIIGREQREYELADEIVVLSTPAFTSFVSNGVSKDRLFLLPIGARVEEFQASTQSIADRVARIRSGQRLRVLFVGALSMRKGFFDLTAICKRMVPIGLEFRLVGPIARESRGLVRELEGIVEIVGHVPERELPDHYGWADVFLFPTIEDGAALVLMQARAHALPIITTTNCCGPDIIRIGETGWIVQPRDLEAFIERLHWCHQNRVEFSEMAEGISSVPVRSWDDVARDFDSHYSLETT